MFLAACDTAWTVTGGGVLTCSGTVSQVDLSGLLTTFDLSQLDPNILAAAFGSGFILVATIEVVAISVAAILDLIRR